MDEAYLVAEELWTRIKDKKYGSYLIYEDEKIIIFVDTYYPNLEIYVKNKNEEKVLVCHKSGHGYYIEYHPGNWENYIKTVLYPKALEAEKNRKKREEIKKEQEHQEKFGCCPKDCNEIFN